MNIKDLEEEIRNADKIVVGIGAELSAKKWIPYDDIRILNYFKSIGFHKYECVLNEQDEYSIYLRELYYNYYLIKEGRLEAYDYLDNILEGKDYFIITSNTDDLIYHSGLQKERITAPCGSIQLMQCGQACQHQLFESTSLLYAQIKEYETTGERNKISCGNCKKPLTFNIRTQETKANYIEEGYLSSWNQYTAWLQRTLNTKLLVLELGEGFQNPSLFRLPFEKIVFFNKQAKLIRVHETLYQTGEEIRDKSIPVHQNSMEFLLP